MVHIQIDRSYANNNTDNVTIDQSVQDNDNFTYVSSVSTSNEEQLQEFETLRSSSSTPVQDQS